MKHRTDAELLAGVANRDTDAFGELYDRHAGRLLALCRRIVGSAADAEEVLQDVFVQAWHQASRFDPIKASVTTWLVVMARSRAIDRLRARRAAPAGAAAADVEFDERPAADANPECRYVEHEQAAGVRRQVELLPADQRTILELAFFEGFTHTEIAVLLRQPLGTIKTKVRLALLALRRDVATTVAPASLREPSPFTIVLSKYLSACAGPSFSSVVLKGLTVLVVDDDADTVELTRTVLESAGARVMCGRSAAVALRHARLTWPDVVLTDIAMPEVDGYSFAEQVQSIAPTERRAPSIVAFTAHRLDDGARAQRACFAGYLAKPTSPKRMVEIVAQLCGRIG